MWNKELCQQERRKYHWDKRGGSLYINIKELFILFWVQTEVAALGRLLDYYKNSFA